MRIIYHLDMNAFFASVEQACNPFLRGKPVAVVISPDYANSAIVARSYEAKAYGVKTFSRLIEARQKCPHLIAIKGNHLKYYDINKRIYSILSRYTPIIEVYSIDEFFLDLTTYFKYRSATFEEVAQEIKAAIAGEIHPVLKCSIGVGPNKLLAKVGSDYKKPDGLTMISWEERYKFLDSMEIEDLWGIGYSSTEKLKRLGVKSAADIRTLSEDVLRESVGSYWTRLKMIANGEWYDEVDPSRHVQDAKSMMHAHTLENATADLETLKSLTRKLCEKLAHRLFKHQQKALTIGVAIRPEGVSPYGYFKRYSLRLTKHLPFPTDFGKYLYIEAEKLLEEIMTPAHKVRLISISVERLIHERQQFLPELEQPERISKLNYAINEINHKYGDFTIRSADILNEKAKESYYDVERQAMTFHPG
jgi:DNA polymerase-4